MRINVGSGNEVKVKAVKELLEEYDSLSGASVTSVEVSSGISEQPKSLEETIIGAKNRALNAFQNCDYAFGLEDGLMSVPKTKTGYMNVCVCSIFDGKDYSLGLSAGFEFPVGVTQRIFNDGDDANQAFFKEGLTAKQKVGSLEGAIGILTKNRLRRKEYAQQAIQMALIQLEHTNLYRENKKF